mmetsp:Transcript_33656/g.73648  ORF Transcript_33656/g.73648 Transcript_33656/m.73648 type:complete len:223 (-) Transcript_33656:170-838(-)
MKREFHIGGPNVPLYVVGHEGLRHPEASGLEIGVLASLSATPPAQADKRRAHRVNCHHEGDLDLCDLVLAPGDSEGSHTDSCARLPFEDDLLDLPALLSLEGIWWALLLLEPELYLSAGAHAQHHAACDALVVLGRRPTATSPSSRGGTADTLDLHNALSQSELLPLHTGSYEALVREPFRALPQPRAVCQFHCEAQEGCPRDSRADSGHMRPRTLPKELLH